MLCLEEARNDVVDLALRFLLALLADGPHRRGVPVASLFEPSSLADHPAHPTALRLVVPAVELVGEVAKPLGERIGRAPAAELRGT